MATFVVLRHPVTILVKDLTNPDNLSNDIFSFSTFDIKWSMPLPMTNTVKTYERLCDKHAFMFVVVSDSLSSL